MNAASRLGALAVTFFQLGFLAVGGINSVLPEMHRQVVETQHWMSGREFAALFAIAQAAPGPNLLVVTLVGWHVSGLLGALVATGAVVVPTSLMTLLATRVWHGRDGARWRDVVQAGLTPVTVGLVLAASLLLAREAVTDAGGLIVLVATAAITLSGRLHPLWLLAAGAVLGAAGLV